MLHLERPGLLLLASLAGAGTLEAQVVRGRCLERATRTGVYDARVIVESADSTSTKPVAETNCGRDGQFLLELPPGSYQARISAATVTSQPVALTVAQNDTLELTLLADSAAPVSLDTLKVRTQPKARTGRNIIAQAQIEQRRTSARHVGDLVRSLPGISVRESSNGGIAHGMCIESNRRVPTGMAQTRDHTVAVGCAMVKVYLDGYPLMDAGRFMTTIPVRDIESIEFVAPIEGVARYGADAGNGVLLIQTRSRR
jgi:outer membrane receptor protein involved in Fe transport